MSFTQTIKIQDELDPPDGDGRYVVVHMMISYEGIDEKLAGMQFSIPNHDVDIDVAFALLMHFFNTMDAWSDREMPPQDMTFVFEEIDPNDNHN